MKCSTLPLLIIVCLVSYWPSCAQDTLVIQSPTKSIPLTPYLKVWEDEQKTATLESLKGREELFLPLLGFEKSSPTSVFWLKANISNGTDAGFTQVLDFATLSYVDVWLEDDAGGLTGPIKSGSFRAKSDLVKGVNRRSVRFDLPANTTKKMFLRVEHTKKYDPQLMFTLTGSERFAKVYYKQRLLDLFLMGCLAIGFLSTLFSFLVRFYKPYLWLMLYIVGISGYSLGVSGYLVDWLMPEYPIAGAKVTVLFVYLLLAGFYLLTIDFCDIKNLNIGVYRLFRRIILVIAAFSPVAFVYNMIGNFYLMSMFMACTAIVLSLLVLYGLFRCYSALNSAQRIHAAGILVFVLTALLIDFSIIIFGEKALKQYGLLSLSSGIVTYIIFDIALKKQLFLYELEKHTALLKLNELQQNQNRLLEESVETRTQELHVQKRLLEDSYHQIKLLNLEMQHRIKNNLQFLYGLFKLKEMGAVTEDVREILRFGLCKIGIMAVMQDHLHKEKPDQLPLDDYIKKIISQTAELYQGMHRVVIHENIAPDIVLSNNKTLPLGLIVAELLTNSMKHAFTESKEPFIRVDINRIGQNVVLTYIDNGSDEAAADKITKGKGIGLTLISDLARQLNAIYTIRFDKGVSVHLNFPLA